MAIPRWSMIGLVVGILIQFVLSWLQSKKMGSGRKGLLPTALMAGALSIMFVREFFAEVPVWIELPVVTICFLLDSDRPRTMACPVAALPKGILAAGGQKG